MKYLQPLALPVYRLASSCATPFLPLWLRWRLHEGKEDKRRYREKLGYASLARPEGALLWIHAASVGEANSVMPLIEALIERSSTLNILVTTGTRSSAELLDRKLPERAFHQYVPLDSPFVMRRFLKHWQPNLAILVESELWPNMIRQTAKSGCRMLLVNGRMSDNSYRSWLRFPRVISRLLNCFETIYPLNQRSSQYFANLGADRLKMIGNLKYDAPILLADSKLTGAVVQMMQGRPCWLAASTHPGEEEIAGDAHRILKEIHPDLLTIIAPRHPHRAKDIAAMLRGKDLRVAQRSQNEPITPETDIYLADSLGELGIFYRLAGIVWMGGTMVPRGGQNPLEAARLDCALIFGPYMHNFPDILRDFEAAKACITVRSPVKLQEAVENLLVRQEEQEAMAQAALGAVEAKKGALAALLQDLVPLIKTLDNENENT